MTIRDWFGRQLMRVSGTSRLMPPLHEIRQLLVERSDVDALRQRQWQRYTSLTLLRSRYPDVFESTDHDLSAFELSAFSQNGEDGVLIEVLHRIGMQSRSFVEFGAGDGTENCCCLLADVLGWSGLFAEVDPAAFDQLAAKYQNNENVKTVKTAITPENVQDVFREHGVPTEPDVLSIDVDGSDYWIWEALERYRPRVAIIEYNSSLAASDRLVQPREIETWGKTSFFGTSLGALLQLAEKKGYTLVHLELTGANAFFVRTDVMWDGVPKVVRRGPNYDLDGNRHATDSGERSYVDPLDSASG